MKERLAGTALALESAVNGMEEAIRVGSTEVANDPAIQLLTRMVEGLLASVIELARRLDTD